MEHRGIACSVVLTFLICACTVGAQEPRSIDEGTVENTKSLPFPQDFEPTRYLGKWFEVARLPTPMQPSGTLAAAEYFAGGAADEVLVENTAYASDGKVLATIKGRAKILDGKPPRLAVTFGPVLPQDANYYVMYVDRDYQHAVVGTPNRKSLWILSRTASVTQDKLDELIAVARSAEFETEKLVINRWNPASQTWPQWRGPNRDGSSIDGDWPDELSQESLQQLWRVELGPSYSGPVLSDELVFTTETRGESDEVVYAFDRKTGDERWHADWKGALKVPFFAAANGSWIRSTPAYDGQRLYVAGIRDVIVCLDAKTGHELWRVDFVEKFGSPLPAFGFVCSPLVDEAAVYVQAGGGVAKLDKLNGNVVWRSLDDGGGTNGSAFSSPIIATVAGKRQLVVQTRTELAGLDLESGIVLWKQTVPAFRGMNIQTPLVVDDAIFTSSYQNRSWLYEISQAEGSYQVTTTWENNAQGYMSSPVVIDGHVYMHLQNGRFACVDLATGDRTWTSKPYGKYASLVAHGDKILTLVQDGRLLLLAADPEKFSLLGEAKLTSEETWAHLAVSGDEIYVRELKALSAYRWK
ncbi:MAG: PQQ-binding-like beta-propeller repeat protein [Planctomycetales bacterium]|nr:PQQ-binding-like beta-propeller repeat protein [Planctomycetales bacterium]